MTEQEKTSAVVEETREAVDTTSQPVATEKKSKNNTALILSAVAIAIALAAGVGLYGWGKQQAVNQTATSDALANQLTALQKAQESQKAELEGIIKQQAVQLEQANRVRDLGARATDAVRELLLCDAEVGEQLLVGRRLFERIQLRAVQVLKQRVAQHVLVCGRAHDRGNVFEAGAAARAEAALAHDELVARLARGGRRLDLAHDDRLKYAELANRVRQLFERLFVELSAGLHAVRHDVTELQASELCAWHLAQLAALSALIGRRGGDPFA